MSAYIPPDWMADGLCSQVGGDTWFPEKGDDEVYKQARKIICKRCPVTSNCLQYALDNAIPHGLWGGLSPKQRQKISARKPGETLPKPITHGTEAGARAHRVRGEKPCPSCSAGAREARKRRGWAA